MATRTQESDAAGFKETGFKQVSQGQRGEPAESPNYGPGGQLWKWLDSGNPLLAARQKNIRPRHYYLKATT
jgi:hypothetical protein